MEVSIPPNLARHLQKVALLMPNSRQISGTGRPASTRLSAAMAWLSVNLDFFA